MEPHVETTADVAAATKTGIETLDLIVILVYLIGIVAVGLLSVRNQKLDSENYFLAGRSLKWPVIGAALFASNISTIHLVGLAADGYRIGIVVGNFEWMAVLTLTILLAFVFAPIYFRANIGTMPEFYERRYGPASRTFVAFMAVVSALMIHIGMSLYAGARVFDEFFGIPMPAAIGIIAVTTTIYTVVGGLRAVVVTETIQTIVLLIGAVLITALAAKGLPDAGVNSWSEFRAAAAVDGTDRLNMLQQENPGGFTWYGFLLGFPILGIWYWCSDQTIVQRILAAKTEHDARYGALFGALLKVLPPFFMVMPGIIAYIIFKDEIKDPNNTLPFMINQLMPVGLKGLMLSLIHI